MKVSQEITQFAYRFRLLLGTTLAIIVPAVPAVAYAVDSAPSPSYTLQKTVRPAGITSGGWGEEVSVKPGDKVQFALDFKNTGTVNVDKVAIGDRLPVGLTYVPNSTEWASGHTNGQWTKVTTDNWLDGGLNIGAYLPDANAIVRFTAQVADADALECGENILTNHAFAKPEGQQNIQDSATVKVTKDCPASPATPAQNITPAASTTPATAEALPNTGAGDIAVLFTAVTAGAAAAHRMYVTRIGRRFSR